MGCMGSSDGGGSGGGGDGTSYDHLFKLVMVGEVGVGKSSLVRTYSFLASSVVLFLLSFASFVPVLV